MDKFKILKTEIENIRTQLTAKKEEYFLLYVKYNKKAQKLSIENPSANVDGWDKKADRALNKSTEYRERAEELYLVLEKSGAYRWEENNNG